MNEREQVISNLLYMKRDCLEGSDTDKTLDRAIALLKAQEPLAVRITDDFGAIKFGNCPKCGSIINNQGYPKSCGCGQAVKWVEPPKEG